MFETAARHEIINGFRKNNRKGRQIEYSTTNIQSVSKKGVLGNHNHDSGSIVIFFCHFH